MGKAKGTSAEAYNVVKMSMSNKHKILVNCPCGAPPNIESTLKLRNYNTRLLPPN